MDLFGKDIDVIEEIEIAFKVYGRRISKETLAMSAYFKLMGADFEVEDATLLSGRAWKIAEFYNFGKDKIEDAKKINLNAKFVDTLLLKDSVDKSELAQTNDDKKDLINIPEGETRESFLKCRILCLKRMLKLYEESIIKDEECFTGDIKIKLIILELNINTLIQKMEDL